MSYQNYSDNQMITLSKICKSTKVGIEEFYCSICSSAWYVFLYIILTLGIVLVVYKGSDEIYILLLGIALNLISFIVIIRYLLRGFNIVEFVERHQDTYPLSHESLKSILSEFREQEKNKPGTGQEVFQPNKGVMHTEIINIRPQAIFHI